MIRFLTSDPELGGSRRSTGTIRPIRDRVVLGRHWADRDHEA
jgi:hypothetical protein